MHITLDEMTKMTCSFSIILLQSGAIEIQNVKLKNLVRF